MRFPVIKFLIFGTTCITIGLSSTAHATNGYFSHGYSLKEKGLAGAGAAYSQDSLAAATNPAGMVWQGNRIDAGASIFSPMRRYSVDSSPPTPGTGFGAVPGAGGAGDEVDSESEFFLIPHFGWNKMLDTNSSFGISAYANGGMNTNWKASDTAGGAGVFGGGTAGVNLAQLFVTGTYSQKISGKSSWGASAIFAIQRFEAKGLSAFSSLSNNSSKLTNNGTEISTGFGAKAGWQGQVAPGVALGASYQSEIKMSELDDYAGLFAEKGDFDIPSTWTIGLAWDVTPQSKLVFDIQRINYEDVRAVSNPSLARFASSCAPAGLGGTGTSGCLGGSDGAGFGWEDMTIYKLGYQWQTSSDMTWRVGYSKGDQPIPEEDVLFNILAPGVVEEHITFGFTKTLGKGNEITFAAMYAPEECVEGFSNGVLQGIAAGNQRTEICMDQYEVGASWAWKF